MEQHTAQEYNGGDSSCATEQEAVNVDVCLSNNPHTQPYNSSNETCTQITMCTLCSRYTVNNYPIADKTVRVACRPSMGFILS